MTEHDHPSDEQLIEWLDETARAGHDTASHLAVCPDCQIRLAEFEAVFEELRRPAKVSEATLTASRAAIEARIRAQPGTASVRPLHRRWWVPATAVASIGLIVLGLSLQRSADDAVRVTADANRAAETAFEDLGVLAELEPEVTPALTIDDSAELELEFSTLPLDDQRAILDALATERIEL